MEELLQVRPLPSPARTLNWTQLSACAEQHVPSLLWMYESNRVPQAVRPGHRLQSNFAVLLQSDKRECGRDEFLLAAAAPCFPHERPEHR